MKIIKKSIKIIIILILILIGALYATDNEYILRGIRLTYLKGRTTAGIYDYKDFGNRVVFKGNPQKWENHEHYNKVPLTDTLKHELERFETDAFLIFKDGNLWHETYWNKRTSVTISNSFSMSKTMVSMLLFKAIENGEIESLEQKITDFLPNYKDDKFGKDCTVGDLSAMTSGYDWKEDYYLPINPTAKSYLGDNIEEQILSRGFVSESGRDFEYLSGNTQLLSIILEKATGKNVSTLLSEHFWKPMGMENDALWSLDGNDKMEKSYCCVNATALDFGKIGQLFLQKGNWKGRQLLDTLSINKMITPNAKAFQEGQAQIYGYSVWTDYEHQPSFYGLLGHLGQRVLVIPSENIVIVRLGKKKDGRNLGLGILDEAAGTDIYYYIDEVLKMIE